MTLTVDYDNPHWLLAHASVGSNALEPAWAFYDAVMPALGAKRLMTVPGAVAYGRAFPEFWVQAPHDGRPAGVGNGGHIAFWAASRAQVDAFHAAALAAGGTCDGPPGPRPLYTAAYYGCFVRDPDGNKIEAMYWDRAIAAAGETTAFC